MSVFRQLICEQQRQIMNQMHLEFLWGHEGEGVHRVRVGVDRRHVASRTLSKALF